ncbi:hypothetical protein [Bradyrhizobium sp. 192]|uniref:hypothetical protein n=1 Tax=Bradyrhizobium sp. 192 TaxID=2782660 RepID=UPI001FFF6042|nr:hypothetical protein [Bradyrhizobium sp. 192]
MQLSLKTAVRDLIARSFAAAVALHPACSLAGAAEDTGAPRAHSEKGDGASDAPHCDVQYPSLLSRYRVRPSWPVAGVDYCVGHPAAIGLKDPAAISMAGVTVDRKMRVVTVAGSGITLDGYDFSLDGGWGVVVQGDNAKIQNCNFFVGANRNQPVLAAGSSSNVTVAYCTIDGHNDPNVGGLIEHRGSGTLTVQYCWLKNAGGDMVQMHNGGREAGLALQYNLIQNAGMAPGAHGDYTEFIDGPFTVTIEYNTTAQSGGASQGFMVEPDIGSNPGRIISGEIVNNTFTGTVNAFTGVTVADIVNTFTVRDNYFDPSRTSSGLAFGGLIRGGPNDNSAKSIYLRNVNMLTGAIVQDVKTSGISRR